jgi:hypothetical protein
LVAACKLPPTRVQPAKRFVLRKQDQQVVRSLIPDARDGSEPVAERIGLQCGPAYSDS